MIKKFEGQEPIENDIFEEVIYKTKEQRNLLMNGKMLKYIQSIRFNRFQDLMRLCFVDMRFVDSVEALAHQPITITDEEGVEAVFCKEFRSSNAEVVYVKAIQRTANHVTDLATMEEMSKLTHACRANCGMFITTSKIAEEARNFAQENNILCYDGYDWAEEMIGRGIACTRERSYTTTIDDDFIEARVWELGISSSEMCTLAHRY